jgi:hypothetical protein
MVWMLQHITYVKFKLRNMFYCKLCQVKNNYPESISTSVGTCEICGTIAVCYDVPSSHLPKDSPKDELTINEINVVIDLDDFTNSLKIFSHTTQIIILAHIAERLTLDVTATAIRDSLNK